VVVEDGLAASASRQAGVHGSDGDETTSNRPHGSTARDKTTAADREASGTARAIQVKSGALHRRAAQVVGALAQPARSQPADLLGKGRQEPQSCGRSEVPARAPCAMPDCTPVVTCSAPRVRPRPGAESARTASVGHQMPRNAGEDAARRVLIGCRGAVLRETLPRALCMHSLARVAPKITLAPPGCGAR
jgi:hypothetical protein